VPDAKEEFCTRFKARMIAIVGPSYSQLDEDGRTAEEGLSTAAYADETASTYWDDPAQREEGPEACAEADYSYWGD
jgi:hypothetical protein